MNENNTPFYYGTIIIGPSGSGKSTFGKGLHALLGTLNRKRILINLDPANYNDDERYSINIKNLIDLEEVMQELQLGPNAALVYCMDFLEKNLNWLETQLLAFKDHYLIFDFPGQIELYLNNDSVISTIAKLTNPQNPIIVSQLVAIEMFDALNVYDSNLYISQCLMSLVSQMNLEMPHISVLSKIDLLKSFGVPPNNLECYFEANDIKDLFTQQPSKFVEKYQHLNVQLAELLDLFNKVSFAPLYVESKELMMRLLLAMDIANGYYYLEQQDPIYKQLQTAYEQEGQQLVTTEVIMNLESELFPDDY